MLLIKKNTVNQVDLTLNEKVTIDAPVYFLFRVKRVEGDIEKTFVCTDETGLVVERYNRFMIEENTTEDLTDGVVSLPTGQYDYEVYAQHSSTNLDYLEADEQVEAGYMLVIQSSVVIDTGYEPTTSVTVYEPGE